ncbi:MAG: hypothetical protein ACOYLE_10915 [Bacteroidales bacterium]
MKKFDFKKIGMKVVGLGAGAVAANAGVKFLPATMDNKIVSAIQIGVGVILPEVIGQKSELLESVGNGMIAVGAANLVSELTSKTTAGLFGFNYNEGSRIMGDDGMNDQF